MKIWNMFSGLMIQHASTQARRILHLFSLLLFFKQYARILILSTVLTTVKAASRKSVVQRWKPESADDNAPFQHDVPGGCLGLCSVFFGFELVLLLFLLLLGIVYFLYSFVRALNKCKVVWQL
jgi:hypothetical protein